MKRLMFILLSFVSVACYSQKYVSHSNEIVTVGGADTSIVSNTTYELMLNIDTERNDAAYANHLNRQYIQVRDMNTGNTEIINVYDCATRRDGTIYCDALENESEMWGVVVIDKKAEKPFVLVERYLGRGSRTKLIKSVKYFIE
ncbi:MAG: hypothetical protein IK117_06085 [Bacteroidales bacterium]|nr:hypothetical protein [Bacteroidales bacterium]